MMKEVTKDYLRRFLKEVVWNDSWFKELHKRDNWDLFVLSGSLARGDHTPESDIDLFLILPHEAQRKHDISPIHLYDYKDYEIDVSKVASEKLLRSCNDKRNLYWWHKTEIVFSNNEKIEDAFYKASSISKEELHSLLWNNYCLFHLMLNNLRRCISQDDSLGAYCCFCQSIEIVMEIALNVDNVFVALNKKGKYLKDLNPDLYSLLTEFSQNPSDNYEKEMKVMREKIKKILINFGFSENELDSWSNHNLHKFLHQAK